MYRRPKFHTPELTDEARADIVGLAPDNKSKSDGALTFTAKKKARFLACLAAGWTVTKACEYAPISTHTVRQHRKKDPEFDKLVQDAIEAGTDLIEDEATRRAVDGYDRPIFQGGEEVGVVREYSDSLMAILLKGRRRSKYGDKQEITGADGAPLMSEPVPDRKLAMTLLYTLGSTLNGVSLAELLGPEPKAVEHDKSE